jgi:hypothetical protein
VRFNSRLRLFPSASTGTHTAAQVANGTPGPRHDCHKRDKEIGYINVPGTPSQPASNIDTRVPCPLGSAWLSTRVAAALG